MRRRRFASAPWLTATVASVLAAVPAAHALQVLEAVDGVTVEARLSEREPTRIRIDGAPITSVFGNVYASRCGAAGAAGAAGADGKAVRAAADTPEVNPHGEVVVECDPDKGEVYVRPVGPGAKPINLFVSSPQATYTLLLRRADVPADTIVIRDRTPRPAASPPAGGTTRPPQHVASLKPMLFAMASDLVPGDIRVEEVHRPVTLWREVRVTLVRTYEGRGLVGERYLLTNVSAEPIVLAEQEFDRENGQVVAVAVEHHNLRPGDTTAVHVIRRGVR